MSSVFLKPLPDSRNKFLLILVPFLFSLLSDVTFFNIPPPEEGREFLLNPEQDYDELLVRLSVYAFNRLSPSDQLEQVEEIRRHVKSEEMELQGAEENDEAFRHRTFAELFKKLPYSDQLKRFLSKVIQKYKRERMIGELTASFQHLDAKHRQQLIEQIVPVTPENLQQPGEAEDGFRLRRFTQLSKDYTDYVYKRTRVFWKDRMESCYENNDSEWMSSFADFFSGFSIIWFQGQSPKGQDLLIEQLPAHKVGGIIKNRLPDETEEDFKLRRSTDFCKNVVDFRFQDKVLYDAEYKLEQWGVSSSARMICKPQYNSDTDAELLSQFLTFGFSLLSPKYQQQKIDEMSNQVDGVVIERCLAAEDIRITRFTELLDQVPRSTRLELFDEFTEFFSNEKKYVYLTRLFKQLGSKDQAEVVDKLFYEIIRDRSSGDSAKLIIERFRGESEEGVRLRRFQKICMQHLSDASYYFRLEAQGRVVPLLEENADESHYAEFMFGVSILWFKSRCASDHRRNPIYLILFGEVEFNDTIEKLPEESDENFRLRRFAESFKQLPFTLRKRIFDYIQQSVVPFGGRRQSAFLAFEESEAFDPGFIKVKYPNQKDQGGAITQGAGAGAGGQWTCQIGG